MRLLFWYKQQRLGYKYIGWLTLIKFTGSFINSEQELPQQDATCVTPSDRRLIQMVLLRFRVYSHTWQAALQPFSIDICNKQQILLVHFDLGLPFQEWHSSQLNVDVVDAFIEEVSSPLGNLRVNTKPFTKWNQQEMHHCIIEV